FALASWTRFSPNTRWPAAITGAMASAPKVLEIATSVTVAGSRPASRQAAAICSRTAASPSDRFMVSIRSTPAAKRFKFYLSREDHFYVCPVRWNSGSRVYDAGQSSKGAQAVVVAEQAYFEHPRPFARARASGHRAAGVRPRPRAGIGAQPSYRPRPRRGDRSGAARHRIAAPDHLFHSHAAADRRPRLCQNADRGGKLPSVSDRAHRQRALDSWAVGRRNRRPH